MKKLIIISLLILNAIILPAQFNSANDVLEYLDGKTFISESSEFNLTFSNNGTILSFNGVLMWNHPRVTLDIDSRSIAAIYFYEIDDQSSYKKFYIDGLNNIITSDTNKKYYFAGNKNNKNISVPLKLGRFKN